MALTVIGTANLTMVLLVISSIFLLVSLDGVTARYALVLEKAGNCERNSKIILNYTYTRETNHGVGHVEYLEKIEPSSNIRVSIAVQFKGAQGSDLVNSYHTMNNSKTDFCVLLNSDIVYLPYMRQFVSIEKYCPVNKGIRTFHKSTVFMKRKPFPTGCWKIRTRMEKNGKLYSCFYVAAQLLESLESERIKCG